MFFFQIFCTLFQDAQNQDIFTFVVMLFDTCSHSHRLRSASQDYWSFCNVFADYVDTQIHKYTTNKHVQWTDGNGKKTAQMYVKTNL